MTKHQFQRSIYSLLIFFVVFQSCIEKVDYESITPPAPQLVVNSYITPDSTMEFFVNKTSNMLDNNYIISDGNIEIWADNSLLTTLTEHQQGHFTSSIKPEIGVEFKIIVRADNMKASAQTHIPDSTKITDFSYIHPGGNINADGLHGTYTTFFLSIDDPLEENYYELKAFTLNTDSVYHKPYIHVLIFSENTIIKAEGDNYSIHKLLFSDKQFNGEKTILNVNTLYTVDGAFNEKTLFLLRTVTKEYYLYHKTLLAHYYNQELIHNPSLEELSLFQITGRPIDVYSNIEGGYGIFAGYSTFIYEIDNELIREY
jgi:hypothetical protein